MIKVDKEFKELIPPLSREEYTQLEENILKEGIRDPLVVWHTPSGDDILIDGHNRWEISAKHAGIRFDIVRKEFNLRDDVKEWIIKNQLGRRNIPAYVRAELALKLKDEIKAKAKQRQGTRTDKGNIVQNSARSRDELASIAGVSHDTIHKVEKIQEKASPETREALRKGETSINQVYSNIIASENQTRKQEEARELREAKKRNESFEEQKHDGIIELDAVKQNKEDQELIANDFIEDYHKMIQNVRRFGGMIADGRFEQGIKCAKRPDVIQAMEYAQECMRTFMKIQRVIGEVLDEK